MEFNVYSLEQGEVWDQLVRTFARHDIYYLSGYVKAFQLHGDGEPLLFYYQGNDGLRGINVVMKRDIAKDLHFAGRLSKDQYFDFATPYGYGGWLLEGNGAPDHLFSAYEEWCRANGIVSEFVRFHPVLQNQKQCQGRYEVVRLGNTIMMDVSSDATIWANISSKNRNVIRKALKNGVRIYNGRSPQLFDTFRTIYNATMDKDHAADYYYFEPGFYQSILNDLPHNAQIFYAEYEGKVIAASIMLCAKDRMNYHLSGSVRDSQNLAPTNLLLYEAALWGWTNGYKTLHLGGGVGVGEDSLFSFKKAFNRSEPLPYYIGKKVFEPEKYEELLSLRGDVAEGSYFPKYRA